VRGENGLGINLREARGAIGQADVLVLGFDHIKQRVLFDFRPGPGGPLIRLVAPVSTARERLTELHTLRPGIPDPQRFIFVRWPLGLDSLVDSGVWDVITERAGTGNEKARADCDGALQRLRLLDAKETREAIAGESYRSLWPKGGG
jgi:hypothetical protein